MAANPYSAGLDSNLGGNSSISSAAGGLPAASMNSLLLRPHHAREVSDWLANRATTSEVQRFARLMSLVQQASTAAPAATQASAATAGLAGPRQRPASSLGFSPTQASAKRQQQLQQQAGSSSSPAATATRPASARPASASWHHTTTTQAAAAAAVRATAHSRLAPALATTPPAPGAAPAAATSDTLWGPGISSSREPAAALPASSRTPSRPASAVPPPPPAAAAGAVPGSVNVTTAQAFHGLKELYPDLWAATAPICRPRPAPNKNFISEWGQALRQGADEAWAPYLASSYTLANLQVAKPTDEYAVRADNALVAWAAKQKLYAQELLAPQAAAAVAALLEGRAVAPTPTAAGVGGTAAGADAASDGAGAEAAAVAGAGPAGGASQLSLAEKKELVEVLRQLAAVVGPEGDQSMSHSSHKPQASIDQPETLALLKEQTRIKTMGFPRKVAVKGLKTGSHHAGATAAKTAAAAAAAAATAGQQQRHGANRVAGKAGAGGGDSSSRGPKAVNQREETLASNVPLSWAATAVGTPTTSYTAAFGSNPGPSPQMSKTVFQEVNVGFGHMDTQLHPPGSALFPVQQLYLQQPLVPGQQPRRQQADQQATTQRRSYQSRDPASVAASVVAAREQIEASQAARNKSLIPLGRGGLQLGSSAQWVSSYGADFVPREADLSANKSMAAAVAQMFSGPTIAFGRIAGMRAADAAGIDKWQQQQAAAAAAKAAAEAELDRRVASAKAP